MTEARMVVGGRYELTRLVGTGGMAEVWQAADLRLNGKVVAVKRLLGFQAGSPQSARDLDRARREAFAVSQLNHPNLVQVTDFVAEAGEPFIVMEFVAGQTLADLAAPHGLPVDQAARVMAQVAGALAEAHAVNIVHRDIKPANIMLDRHGAAKLADFGIARSAEDPRLTQTGFFTGTIAYLAPEVLDGDDSTAASDMWSFGATLYEIIEGRRAFDGPTTAAILLAVASGRLPVAVKSGPLTSLINALLARDPAARPTAAQTAHALHQIAVAPVPSVPHPAPAPPPPLPPPTYFAQPVSDPTGYHPQQQWLPSGPTPHPRQARSKKVWAIVAAAVVAGGVILAIVLATGGGGAKPDPSVPTFDAYASAVRAHDVSAVNSLICTGGLNDSGQDVTQSDVDVVQSVDIVAEPNSSHHGQLRIVASNDTESVTSVFDIGLSDSSGSWCVSSQIRQSSSTSAP